MTNLALTLTIDQAAPERIYGWQHTQLSIARFYGGIRHQGRDYVIAEAEEGQPLVRRDIYERDKKMVAQQEREKWRRLREEFEKAQEGLF